MNAIVVLVQMGQHAATKSIRILAPVSLGTPEVDARQVISFYVNSIQMKYILPVAEF